MCLIEITYIIYKVNVCMYIYVYIYVYMHLKVTYELRTARTPASLFTQLCHCKSVSPAILRIALRRHYVRRT